MPRPNHTLKLIAVAAFAPLAYFVCPFLCGFFNSQGLMMLLMPVILIVPLATGLAIGVWTPRLGNASRFGLGVLACILSFALFFIFPAGAKSWTLGSSTNFQLTKHPSQVQQWAVGVLERYEAGKLNTSTNAPYWALGKAELDTSEVPPSIGGLWLDRPSIGIAEFTPDGWIVPPSTNQAAGKISARCVVFSWYLNGFLVGRPDFHSDWNPWYIHEIAPGIYAYHGMK